MEQQLARLAVAQVLRIVYTILAAGVVLKIHGAARHAFEPPVVGYARTVRDFGLWMMSVPVLWSACCFWLQRRPEADHSTFTGLYASGIIIALLLQANAVWTTTVVRFV